MSMAHDTRSIEQVLATLRDSPVDNEGASEEILGTLYSYLIGTPSDHGLFHWFCGRALPTTIAAATFLLRLFAYNSPLVEQWRKRLRDCLKNCAGCVKGLQEAKVTSRATFFGAYADDVLERFYEGFMEWELSTVLEDIAGHSLASGPAAIGYRIVSNLEILRDSRVMSIIHSEPPTSLVDGWPCDPVPPGILILLFSERPDVRNWAETEASRSKFVPIDEDQFSKSHIMALDTLSLALNPMSTTSFQLTRDPQVLWSSFRRVLKYVPVKILQRKGIYRVVQGHLHDTGPHFQLILQCFEYLTNHIDPSSWQDEGPEYPEIIFDSIKENASLSEMLLQHTATSAEHPLLSWCPGFLSAIEGQPAQADVFVKMADFLCEELQHERFGEARPAIMLTAINLFLRLNQQKKLSIAMSKVLDIHAEIIVAVAFSRSHDSPAWQTARNAAYNFIKSITSLDVHTIARAIQSLSHTLATHKDVDVSEVPLTGGRRIWKGMYQALSPGDDCGMALIIEVLAQTAHLDVLAPQPFGLKQTDQLGVNRAMSIIWDGLREGLARYTESSRASALLDLFQRPQVVEHVFMLLLSPVADIQLSAESLVGLAFDVDGRQDCYRALLENHSDAALEGLFQALKTFTKYAITVAEACSLAKHLVRYLQDVIEVLCSRQDGLLFIPRFLRAGDENGPWSRVPELWKLMNQAITVIFKRTVAWAPYFQNEEMVFWMRDALICDQDLLAQLRVFETAANSRQQVTQIETGSLTDIGKQMVDDLQLVLPELTRWLRLSEQELLYQTFELLNSLLNTFYETRVSPLKTSLQKVWKHIQGAREDGTKTRLDASRLLRLENMLTMFTSNEVKRTSDKARHSTKLKPTVEAKESEKQRKRKLDGADSFPTYQRESIEPSKFRRPSEALTTSSLADEDEDRSSTEDDDDSQGVGALASLSSMQRSPRIKRRAQAPRQIKLYEAPTAKNPIQLRLERQAQEAKKYQRLKPDLSGLYRIILSWNYAHEGEYPPGPQLKPSHVPVDRFTDYAHYRRVLEPLLLLECWAQIVQSKEEVGESYRFKISSRQFIDDWVDVDMIYTDSVKKDWRLSESDVVLLRQKDASILGKVVFYKTPMGRAIETKIRCVAGLDPGLRLDTEWQLSKVFSLSTINREYSALLGLPFYEMCSAVLSPALPPNPTPDTEVVKKVMSTHRVNGPQAIAISSCLDTVGFSLIQGPPGTGKTSTIVALVMAHIARRPRRITVPGTKNSKVEPPPDSQILICAPSNAAIDEIAHRLRDSDTFRNQGKNVVRLGAVKSMNPNIIDISLDEIVDGKLNVGKDTGTSAELAALRAELEGVKSQRQRKLQELDSIRDNSARVTVLQDEISRLNSKRTSLAKKYDEVKDKRIKESRGLDMSRRAFRIEVLQSANVICTTLSGSGSDVLQDLEIDMVIIDEASQAIELSALIPLKYQPKHCILVGDPQQLPPTVLSQEATRFRYNESLFVRLQRTCPNSIHLLSIQYRMHPMISKLPSTLFYQARLKDGPDMEKNTRKPWHEDPKFGVYRFLDIKSVEEKSGRSIRNIAECRIAVALFSRLRKAFTGIDFDGQVGVISMYRGQILELRRQFTEAFGADIQQTVDFNTVDGFQGQEKSIIILSCVRAGPGLEAIGFLSDVRRMNVALTRAKSSLFILGNAATLSRSNEVWSSIVSDARSRNSLVEVDSTYFSAPSNRVQLVSSPTKTKKQASTVASLPDLATPRELKATVDQRTSTATPSQLLPLPPPPSKTDDPSHSAPPAPPKTDNLKRRLESAEDLPPSKKLNLKPRPPRPKDAGASMFIPKKKR